MAEQTPEMPPLYLNNPEISEPDAGYTIKYYSDGTKVWLSPDGTQTNFSDGSVVIEHPNSTAYFSGDQISEQPSPDFG